jgi:hypothetical protein
MAETADADTPQESAPEHAEGNRVAYAVMAGLAFVFIVGSIVAGSGKTKKSTAGDEGVRALVLPAGDIARTVVIPPCGTGTTITARNVASQVETPGATVVRLPEDILSRVLLIPRCSANTSEAGAETVAPVPSSVFVVTTGATTAAGTKGSTGTGTIQPRSQLIVPSASTGQMVVVPPCTGKGRAERATVLSPPAGSPTALIAPRC